MHGVFREDVQTVIEDAWSNRANAKIASDGMGGTITEGYQTKRRVCVERIYYVGQCPICFHYGRLEIDKDVTNNEHMVICEECLAE